MFRTVVVSSHFQTGSGEWSTGGDPGDFTPYAYVYGYNGADVEEAQSQSNYSSFGALYNFDAVIQWNLCPSGWHVPSNDEWMVLIDHLGGELVAGHQMKSQSGWDGSNSSGFTGLPGGAIGGSSYGVGGLGHWWSSSYTFSPWTVYLSGGDFSAYTASQFYPDNAFSVRCLSND